MWPVVYIICLGILSIPIRFTCSIRILTVGLAIHFDFKNENRESNEKWNKGFVGFPCRLKGKINKNKKKYEGKRFCLSFIQAGRSLRTLYF